MNFGADILKVESQLFQVKFLRGYRVKADDIDVGEAAGGRVGGNDELDIDIVP